MIVLLVRTVVRTDVIAIIVRNV